MKVSLPEAKCLLPFPEITLKMKLEENSGWEMLNETYVCQVMFTILDISFHHYQFLNFHTSAEGKGILNFAQHTSHLIYTHVQTLFKTLNIQRFK